MLVTLPLLFFIYLFIYLLTYLLIYSCVGSSFLYEGFLQLRRVGATLHRGARASHYRGLLLQSTGSRRAGSVVVAHGPSCSEACGIFPDQGSNPCPLHWQADSQPLHHQGSPTSSLDGMSMNPDCAFLRVLYLWLSFMAKGDNTDDVIV